MSDVNVSEKLVSIAQREQQIVNTVRETNTQLEQVLYGTGEGGKSYYDMFWDDFQQNGTRNDYSYAYAGRGWTAEIFKPNHNIEPTGSISSMFYNASNLAVDLREEQFYEKYGVNIDLSKANNRHQFLSSSGITAVGVIDTRTTSNGLHYNFYYAINLQTIKKLILPDEMGSSYSTDQAFYYCNKLQEITEIEGYFGKTTNFQWCPLNKASLENIVEHLSPTVTGQSITFNKSAVETAFGVTVLDESTYTDEFNTWRNSKSNWTFNYV